MRANDMIDGRSRDEEKYHWIPITQDSSLFFTQNTSWTSSEEMEKTKGRQTEKKLFLSKSILQFAISRLCAAKKSPKMKNSSTENYTFLWAWITQSLEIFIYTYSIITFQFIKSSSTTQSSNRTSSTKKETPFFNLKNQFSLPSATTSAKQDDKSGKKELELSSEVRLEQHKKFINKLHENRVCRSLCDHRFSSPMSRTCWECEKF